MADDGRRALHASMQAVRKHQAEADQKHMNEAGRKLREATDEERGYSQELADRATMPFGRPIGAKRPFDLSPDASTLYDLIVAVKELSAGLTELQQEVLQQRHAVLEANWRVRLMSDHMVALMRHGDVFGLRDDLNKLIDMVHELPDEIHTTMNMPPLTDDPPPLADPK